MRLSRRSFIALTAAVVGACRSDDGSSTSSGPTEPASPDTTTTTADATTTTTAATTTTTTSTTTSTTTTTEPPVVLDDDPFGLGVSSGDPDGSSVVIWTRLTGDLPSGPIPVEWDLRDVDGRSLASGVAAALPEDGHSVHVVVDLPDDGPFDYGFGAGGFESMRGRTSRLGDLDEVRIAAASCQNYESGRYAAHRDIAEWSPDLVVFLGDFIYEGAASTSGDTVRVHEGPEATDLDGYRARYATYLADPQLQASRAACAWLAVWDDHEVANNYAGATTSDGQTTEAFARRRAEAYRAWWEHMPTRLPRPSDDASQDFPIHRAVDVGSLVAISALDGRQFRSPQVCTEILDPGPPCDGVDDPARTMLGAEQEAWLAERFATGGADWNCVAQQTVLTDLRVPVTGGVLNYDQWDGYAPARDRMLADAPGDLVVLTGDIHLAGIGRLTTAGEAVGVEFVTTAISSSPNVDPSLSSLVTALPNIVDAELTARGYTRHVVTRNTWTAEYRSVGDVTDPDSPVATWKRFEVERGSAAVVEVAER